MAHFDPHSWADDKEPLTRSIELSLRLDFQRRLIDGETKLFLDRAPDGKLSLDARGLLIKEVLDAAGHPCPFSFDAVDPIKGPRLAINLHTAAVTIRYQTSPDAIALGWLEPAQTAGGRLPFAYTQCQAIHARSLMPCQDTPRVRITYRVELEVPSALKAVMAARSVGEETIDDQWTRFRFEMTQPIPTYLFAFAVGDLTARDTGPRSRVYAEPAQIDAAAWEFAEMDRLLVEAESMFGPYDWERFDVLVMPPSFPYGGMENPRLTFVTPTLIAGDRSLVNVLAHELAHSWTGNLVTNATMEHFWLNEGFTTFAERRILERIEGEKELSLQAALGRRGLLGDIARFGEGSPMTALRTHLEGIDPDQVYSRIPYEKGYLFLRRIELAVGRETFDRFLKSYIAAFRFRSITTDQFLELLKRELPGIEQQVNLGRWLEGPGLPEDAPQARSEALDRVESIALSPDRLPATEVATKWSASEWQVYLAALPRNLDEATLTALEERFHLSTNANAEIRLGFLIICARSAWKPAFPAIARAFAEIGRMKFLRPLYVALLGANSEARALAVEAFEANRRRYHPVAQSVLEPLIRAPGAPKEEPIS